MGAYRKQLLDINIKKGISGCEDILNTGISIDSSYFDREQRENDEESGYPVEDHDIHGMSKREISIRKFDWDISSIEGERVNRVMPEYPGKEEIVNDKKQIEMEFVDSEKLRRTCLEGKFTLSQPVLKKEGQEEKTIVFLTSVKDDSQQIMIAARKDGKGVYMMTSIKALQMAKAVKKKDLKPIKM